MTDKQFMNALQHIDDSLVAEFVEEDMGKKPSPVRRGMKRFWWVPIPAVAACLCVAIGLHYLAPLLLQDPFGDPPTDLLNPPVAGELHPWSPPVLGDDVPEVEVTAEVTPLPPYVIYHAFSTVESQWYTLVSGDTLTANAPLPAESYLPIYRVVDDFNEGTLDAFIQKWLPTTQVLTGINDTDYEIKWIGTSGVITPSLYTATVGSEESEQNILFSLEEARTVNLSSTTRILTGEGAVSFSCPAEALTEGDLFPTLRKDSSDGEILSALRNGIAYLEKTLGKEFRDADIEWRDIEGIMSSISVHELIVTLNGYPPEGAEAFPYAIASIPSFTVTLNYQYVDYENSDELVLENITYSEPRNTAAYTDLVGKAKTISLVEAEELLEAGYVYGATECLICREAYCDVDFSEYDSVGLVYKRGYAGHSGWYVPFYAFCKLSGDKYAVVYVPAVEVTGLEEYFAESTESHKHTTAYPQPNQ